MADTGSIRQVGQGYGQSVGDDARQQFRIRRRHCSRRENERFDVFMDGQVFQPELFETSQAVWGLGEKLEGPGQGRSKGIPGKGVHRRRLIVRDICFVCGVRPIACSADEAESDNNANESLKQSGPCCPPKRRST